MNFLEKLPEFVANHYVLATLFILMLVALALLEMRRGGKKITAQSAIGLLNKDEAVVVDIREKKEYGTGHIVGSLHIPLNSLKERMDELKKYEDKQIIVADKMGQHSATAVKQLNEAGYSNVVRLAGGISEWQGSNLPLKRKKK